VGADRLLQRETFDIVERREPVSMRIYLDVCCLNRPFDNRAQDRIRLEAEAVLTVLNHCHQQRWTLLGSEVVAFEIAEIPDDDRRQRVELLAAIAGTVIRVDQATTRRAMELGAMGFHAVDALHLACAEKGKADVLLTTDDRVLQKASRHRSLMTTTVANPVHWLIKEVKQ
jgi:predicted nucleic acid-binding protein